METLWKDEITYEGIKFTVKEAEIIMKVLSRLSLNDLRRMRFSVKEQELINDLEIGLTA